MQPFASSLRAILAAGLVFTAVCTKTSDNNPYWSGYVGSYRLSVTWPANDTAFEVFKQYNVPYTVGAAPDTFTWVYVDTALHSYIDADDFIGTAGHDTIALYFVKPYDSLFSIQGATPNGRIISVKDSLIVRAPYDIRPDAILPESTSVTVRAVYLATGTPPAALKIYWSADGVPVDTSLLNYPVHIPIASGASRVIGATLVDRFNHRLALPDKTVRHPGPRPVVSFLKHTDTTRVTLAHPLTVSLAGTFDRGVDTVFWDTNGDGKSDRISFDTAIVATFNSAGRQVVHAWAKNGSGFVSAHDSALVIVLGNRPDFDSLGIRHIGASVHDTVRIKATAHRGDTTVPVTSWTWTTTPGAFAPSTTPTGSLAAVFDSVGAYTITVRCADSQGVPSADSIRFLITVTTGKPVVFPPTPDTVWIFDDTAYTLNARAVRQNGTIDSFYVKWDTATTYTPRAADTLHRRFTKPGRYGVSYYVKDNGGSFSDTVSDSILVKPGYPVLIGAAFDTSAGMLYVFDNRRLVVHAMDTNGTIDSVKVSWRGDTVFTATGRPTGDSTTFLKTFALADTGINRIRIRLIDNDKLTFDTVLTVLVKAGYPVVSSFTTDSTASRIFVNDIQRFGVKAADVNGRIAALFFKADSSAARTDSIVFPGAGILAADTAFRFRFDTTQAGTHTAEVWARDNDAILSAPLTLNVSVRKAPPVLWGDAADTLWVIIAAGVGINYPIHINHFDTNGTIVSYYWNESGPTLGRATSTDTIMRNFSQNDVNHSVSMWIYGKDDDSLVRGGKFTVFADSAPPAPTVSQATSTDSATIYWKNKDVKDGDSTRYRVLLHLEQEPDSSRGADRLSDFRSGYRVSDLLAYQYMFRFKLTPSGGANTYYYQIHARDARGTISGSTTGHTFSF